MSDGLMIALCILFGVSAACSVARILLRIKDKEKRK